MGRKCPPGVICLENMTLVTILGIVAIIGYVAYVLLTKQNIMEKRENERTINVNKNNVDNERRTAGLFAQPGYSYSNMSNDILMNPYEGPVRDNSIFKTNDIRGGIPINIKTQSYDTNYRQIGILTRHGSNKETILPIMGRPLINNRDRWNFYTMSEGGNLVKLPISHKGRNCTSDQGCEDLYNGDIVHVDGYNDAFKVTTYENNSPQYIPYI